MRVGPGGRLVGQQGQPAREGKPARQVQTPNVQAQYPGHARPVAGRGTGMPVLTPGSSQTNQIASTIVTPQGNVLPGSRN